MNAIWEWLLGPTALGKDATGRVACRECGWPVEERGHKPTCMYHPDWYRP